MYIIYIYTHNHISYVQDHQIKLYIQYMGKYGLISNSDPGRKVNGSTPKSPNPRKKGIIQLDPHSPLPQYISSTQQPWNLETPSWHGKLYPHPTPWFTLRHSPSLNPPSPTPTNKTENNLKECHELPNKSSKNLQLPHKK